MNIRVNNSSRPTPPPAETANSRPKTEESRPQVSNDLEIAADQTGYIEGSTGNSVSVTAMSSDVPPPEEDGEAGETAGAPATSEELDALYARIEEIDYRLGEIDIELQGLNETKANLQAFLDSLDPASSQRAQGEELMRQIEARLSEFQNEASSLEREKARISLQIERAEREAERTAAAADEAEEVASDENIDTPEEFRARAEEIKGRIDTSEMSDEMKNELKADVDRLVGLAESAPDRISDLVTELQTIEERVFNNSYYSDWVGAMAQKTGLDEETIAGLAEQAGLDPRGELPATPNQKVLDFIAAIDAESNSPKIEGAVGKDQAAKGAYEGDMEEIQTEIEDYATRIADSSELAQHNLEKALFEDAMDHINRKDNNSNRRQEAMQDIRDTVIDYLKTLYPGANVRTADADLPGGSGRDGNANKDYWSADLISFNGQTFDIYNREDGSLTWEDPNFELQRAGTRYLDHSQDESETIKYVETSDDQFINPGAMPINDDARDGKDDQIDFAKKLDYPTEEVANV
ncbi:MAG: hypothetical protein HYS22_01120 [Deltaproteobacteria bacterium]|nr:hypothetical protein [Deltaproteobacteria bacterium]